MPLYIIDILDGFNMAGSGSHILAAEYPATCYRIPLACHYEHVRFPQFRFREAISSIDCFVHLRPGSGFLAMTSGTFGFIQKQFT